MKLLLEKGADVNAGVRRVLGSPLHVAILTGRVEIAKILIDKGADVNAENLLGNRPLDLVDDSPDGELSRLLIERGAKEGFSLP